MIKTREHSLVGAVEAGGTKFVCAVGSGPGNQLLARTQFPTGDNPARLIKVVTAWFNEQQKRYGALAAIGVASFGPVDLDEKSRTYGFITRTPKPGWKNTDLRVVDHGFPAPQAAELYQTWLRGEIPGRHPRPRPPPLTTFRNAATDPSSVAVARNGPGPHQVAPGSQGQSCHHSGRSGRRRLVGPEN